jgi:hypothetical protein
MAGIPVRVELKKRTKLVILLVLLNSARKIPVMIPTGMLKNAPIPTYHENSFNNGIRKAIFNQGTV